MRGVRIDVTAEDVRPEMGDAVRELVAAAEDLTERFVRAERNLDDCLIEAGHSRYVTAEKSEDPAVARLRAAIARVRGQR
jgi:hypothetical protein